MAAAIPIATIIASYVASKYGSGSGSGGSSGDSADLNDIISLQSTQLKRQDPLHAALSQLGLDLLPRVKQRTYPSTARTPDDIRGPVYPDDPVSAGGGGNDRGPREPGDEPRSKEYGFVQPYRLKTRY